MIYQRSRPKLIPIQKELSTTTIASAASMTSRTVSSLASACLHFSSLEKERAEMLYDVTMELFNRLYYRMYAWDLGLMRSCFLRTFVGRAFTFSEVKFLESMDRYVATELVFKMCLLHHISNDEDALLLANHNVPRLVGLYQSLAFKQGDLNAFFNEFIGYGLMHRHQSAEVEQVVAEIEEMKVGEKDVIYNYDTMYSSPWATHIDFEARHRKITENINGWLRSNEVIANRMSADFDRKSARTFDKIQLILITLAMVFHTEGIDARQLIDGRTVEETQLRYLTMLHRYLKDKYPQKADSKLANAVMMIHEAKEAHDLHKKRLPI